MHSKYCTDNNLSTFEIMVRSAGGPAFFCLRARAAAVPWSQARNRGAAEADASVAAGPSSRDEVAGARKVLKRPAAAPATEVPEASSISGIDDGLFVVYLGVPPPVPAGLVAAVCGEEDAQMLAAIIALWSRMMFWKHHATLYRRCYYRLRQDKEPALFACFNAVCILHREAAGTLWRGGGRSSFAFVVVIQGSVRMDMAGAEGKVLEAGRMEFFTGRSLTLRSVGTPAARAAVAYFESLKSRSCAHRLRKVVEALSSAAMGHSELVENDTEMEEATPITRKRCLGVASSSSMSLSTSSEWPIAAMDSASTTLRKRRAHERSLHDSK